MGDGQRQASGIAKDAKLATGTKHARVVAMLRKPTGATRLPLIKGYLDSGSLVQVMTRYSVPTAGMFVVWSPGQHSTRKVRVLTELLIEHFG